ncbi:mitogen-activated protein kinase kinase kinase [Capronia epimyces CBS 606.96]|uniref:Mitogen-activated protein kinase kinase kinase n=1 Tax=Capronia epimyces CBS 606.96 TaxID=1182542 RepID=W9YHR8_9EURO|nr:mitogen-activated protein kinase kinase kinase [Capronia epimyces CBS 606.96]EXJ89220.1 mitogen-activated protein kinase kinase kinase [Capronia epimyces CBS 606.96]
MAHPTQPGEGPRPALPILTADAVAAVVATEAPDVHSKEEEDVEAAKVSTTGTVETGDEWKDPNLVTWDGPDDPANPKNWPFKTKWTYTVSVSFFAVLSPISSSMIAPALPQLARDLNIHSDIEVELSLSIFILAYAFGPLFFGPASEMWGRVRLLQVSNLWYLAWNLACGFATNKTEMFIFRFLAGAGGSAPMAIGGGAISDVWLPEQRGKAMGIYTLTPVLGPVMGPLAGGWIAEYTTWRWVFWSSSALTGAIQAIGLFWLRESHAPTLLKRKRDRLAKETGNDKLHTESEAAGTGTGQPSTLLGRMGVALVRPARLFTTQPIVQVIAVYMAYLFGVIYLLLATFPVLWRDVYGESLGVGGLNYISIAIGSFLGLLANFHYIDRLYLQLKEKNGGVGRPEFRVPSMFVGSVLVTIGLFWYGWSVQGHAHWIMPNLGVVFFSAGTMACLQSMQTYTVDSYTRYAASAMAAVAILRSLGGFGFPLFAPYMYQALDYGWGTSVLAFVSIGIGIPAPFIFWFFGARLRALSKYAAG